MTTMLETIASIAPAKSAARHTASPLARLRAAFARFKARRLARQALYTLDDFMLRDLGISRCDIEVAIRGELHRPQRR